MFVLVRQIFLHALPDVLRALKALQSVRVEAGVRRSGAGVRHGSHCQLAGGPWGQGRGHVGGGPG